jgi:phosphatidylinositol-3-phosphatase
MMSIRILRIFIPVMAVLLVLPYGIQRISSGQSANLSAAAVKVPAKKYKADHIVVVIEENHSYKQIFNNPNAPYINQLMKNNANLVNHYAIEHPSQPNYLDLFSGSNQGVKDDRKPEAMFKSANLASELLAHKLSFGGYSEGQPSVGFNGPYDVKTNYARKHNPWANFSNLPAKLNMPLTSFPKDYSKLPTVSFVIPNQDHDIHDGTVKEADAWLKQNLDGYVQWAKKHNSILILTWDEDDWSSKNKIPTVIVGPQIKKVQYTTKTDHFTILRFIENIYGLQPLGKSKLSQPLAIWK